MKKIFFASILLLNFKVYAQNLVVKYSCNKGFSVGKLAIFESNALWQIQADASKNSDAIVLESNNPEEDFLVKDYTANLIFIADEANIFQKKYYYKDSLNVMSWKISNNTKTILGEKCKEAKTIFRGRAYTAYYSQKTLLPEGPWKFGGLPGLILEIRSDDGEYAWVAKEIIFNPKEKIKNFSIKNQNYISRQEYIKDYILNFDKIIAKQRANGRKGFLKIQNEEIFYPQAQTGLGLEF